MGIELQSILIGTSPLAAGAAAAISLAILRRPVDASQSDLDQLTTLFLIGLAAQCLHCIEEFVTQFPRLYPMLFSLAPWSDDFYVVFNLAWMGIWILSAIGLRAAQRLAYFPIWFFAIGSIANGIGHPVLSLIVRGYFPGLLTSPLVGISGVLLLRWLAISTRRSPRITSTKR